MSARPAPSGAAVGTGRVSSLRAAELVRHPGHAARAEARWTDLTELRASAERVHAAVRPRFVSTVLLLGGLTAALAAGLSWLAP